MQHWIETVCEPKRLFLAWQPSDLNGARWRWAVGLVTPVGDDFELRYFEPGAEFEAHNGGKPFEDLRALGYIGYPALDSSVRVHRSGVRAALVRRLPPRHRADFAEYAAQFRLRNAVALSDFALLARTEAKLPSDGFSVVDPLDEDLSSCDLLLEVAGYRHYIKDAPGLQIGQEMSITAEPENLYDKDAVAVRAQGVKIGNINRLQAVTFLSWLTRQSVSAAIERLNGTADRPRAFLFVRVEPARSKAAA